MTQPARGAHVARDSEDSAPCVNDERLFLSRSTDVESGIVIAQGEVAIQLDRVVGKRRRF